jgi:hypothetical protein
MRVECNEAGHPRLRFAVMTEDDEIVVFVGPCPACLKQAREGDRDCQ